MVLAEPGVSISFASDQEMCSSNVFSFSVLSFGSPLSAAAEVVNIWKALNNIFIKYGLGYACHHGWYGVDQSVAPEAAWSSF